MAVGKTICIIHRAKGQGNSIEEIFFGLASYMEQSAAHRVLPFFFDPSLSLWSNIKTLRSLKADYYHISGDVNYLLPFLYGKRRVLTIHDIGHYKRITGLRKWVYGLLWLRLPMLFANCVTTVSSFTKQDLKKHFGFERVRVIHNPINPIFTFKPKAFNAACPVILQVGTSPHKNLEGVVAAMEGIPCKLLIIGQLTEAQVQLLEAKQVPYENRFNLRYEEVYQCYEACDLVAFVSHHEGFGMPIIEANAIGRPILSSTVCSLPEVAGDGALLVESKDIPGIRKALQRLLADAGLRERLVQKGLENAKRFSIKNIAEQYLDAYQAIN